MALSLLHTLSSSLPNSKTSSHLCFVSQGKSNDRAENPIAELQLKPAHGWKSLFVEHSAVSGEAPSTPWDVRAGFGEATLPGIFCWKHKV